MHGDVSLPLEGILKNAVARASEEHVRDRHRYGSAWDDGHGAVVVSLAQVFMQDDDCGEVRVIVA